MPPVRRSNRLKRSNIKEQAPAACHRKEVSVEERGPGNQACQSMTIAALPNEILLDIFYIYLNLVQRVRLTSWHTLVHVCQRWRYVVYASSRYLNLQLACTNKSPVKEILKIWPTIPFTLSCHLYDSRVRGILNITAALKSRDRLHGLCIQGILNPLLTRFAAALSKPFPELTSLQLSSTESGQNARPVLPDSFLGGFAPRLRSLKLHSISFPSPQKLLLSATDLVILRIERIPYSGPGYISPEEIVACLSTMTKLEEFALEFLCYRHQPSQPPPTRSVLPALTSLRFEGARAYLEDLLSRTDLPLLDNVDITTTYCDTSHSPLLSELVSRIDSRGAHRCAEIKFDDRNIKVALSRKGVADRTTLRFQIDCNGEHLLPLSQFWNTALPPFPNLEHIYIHSSFPLHYPQHFAESTQWLELLRQFTSVENLHLSANVALRLAGTLKDLSTSQGVTEVLPALQNIFLAGPHHWQSYKPIEYIGQIVAIIRPSGRSVSVQEEVWWW